MNPSQMRPGKRSAQHSFILERTWQDPEDDDDEFEDADSEEEFDYRDQELNAYLVSKRALIKFQEELSRRQDGLSNRFNLRGGECTPEHLNLPLDD